MFVYLLVVYNRIDTIAAVETKYPSYLRFTIATFNSRYKRELFKNEKLSSPKIEFVGSVRGIATVVSTVHLDTRIR